MTIELSFIARLRTATSLAGPSIFEFLITLIMTLSQLLINYLSILIWLILNLKKTINKFKL